MKKTLLVTGVTRMREGFVCVSGLDEEGNFIRPEIHYPERPGIKREFLYVKGEVIIRPLVKVELEFIRPVPKSAYHTEDWEIDGSVLPRLVSLPSDQEKRIILTEHCDESLNSALADQDRSLVIVRPRNIPEIHIRLWEDNLRCHLSFYDLAGDHHDRLAVTDANWLAACKYLWLTDRKHITQRLANALQDKLIFLRIGITREFQGQVWRQVSGVFSIPDWLKGKTFADFDYDFTDAV